MDTSVTGIASVALAQTQQQNSDALHVRVLGKALDSQTTTAAGLISMIGQVPPASPEHLGNHIDVMV